MDTNANRTPEEIIAALNEQIAQQQSIIDGQAEALKVSEAQGANAQPVVTHNRKQYRVLAKQFTIEGKLVKAEELKTNKELVKKLVESESGILELLQKEASEEAPAN